jgi:hypothetical protein
MVCMKGFVSFYYYEPLSGTEAAAWLFIFYSQTAVRICLSKIRRQGLQPLSEIFNSLFLLPPIYRLHLR